MSRPAVLLAMARADFLDRARRTSFLLTLGFAAFLGYQVAVGRIALRIGDARGVYNSAWVGALTALTMSVFLALVGFYLVKGSVGRDRATGVGEILATTPLSRAGYTLGKALSNFLVLAAMAGVLAVAAAAMQLAWGEGGGLEPGALLAPIVLTALPTLALVAAAAVLFETVPGLGGGFGNVVYFFLWAAWLTVPMITGWGDVAGMRLYHDSMIAAARAQIPGLEPGFVLGVMPPRESVRFAWEGIGWSAGLVAERLGWWAAAVGLALVAAVPFDRFDPARWGGRRGREARGRLGGAEEAGAAAGPVADGGAPDAATGGSEGPRRADVHVRLEPLAGPGRPGWGRLVAAELRAALAGRRKLWWLVAAGLFVAGWVAPAEAARGVVLPLAWMWPLLVWGSMGSRDDVWATAALVDSSPGPLAAQGVARWTAGVLVAVAAGLGPGVKAALAGDGHHLACWAAGALFVPALALAAGAWSGGPKLFEAGYTALWYVGPLNRTPPLDFLGAAPAGQRPAVWAAVAVALFAAAVAGRARRLRD